jgi:hypothetical protein
MGLRPWLHLKLGYFYYRYLISVFSVSLDDLAEKKPLTSPTARILPGTGMDILDTHTQRPGNRLA